MRIRDIQKAVHNLAIEKGWWDMSKPPLGPRRNRGELIALIHSELSECLEAMRDGNPKSLVITPYTCAEEELADVVIRIMDWCEEEGWDLEGAIEAKHGYNCTRDYRHGREF